MMAIRRAVLRVLWPALLVLPAWVLLGRAFFGVPLGLQFLGQLLLVPLLFLATGVATLLVTTRRSVRRARAVSGRDAALFALSWLGELGMGAFLVDGSAGGASSSVLTRLGGQDLLGASTALFAVSAVLTVAAVVLLVVTAARRWLTEARERMASSLADLDAVARQAQDEARRGGGRGAGGPGGTGTGPGTGPVITITPRADRPD